MKQRDFFKILMGRGLGFALSGRGTFLLKEKFPKETSACGLIPCAKTAGSGFFTHRRAAPNSPPFRLADFYYSADSTAAQTTAPGVFAADGAHKTPNALKAGYNSIFHGHQHLKSQRVFYLTMGCCVGAALIVGLTKETESASKSAKVLVSSPKSSGRGGQTVGPAKTAAEISVEESVSQLCAILDRSGEMWQKIQDRQYKTLVVNRYIDRYQRAGVMIRKSAESYVSHIDDMAAADPKFLSRPFPEILKMAAVIEYDFGNGEDPDALARKLLGEKTFRENKKRFQQPFGQVYQAR